MKKHTFEASAHAKCILAGEHAVIRGSPAIVMPIPNKVLTLHYEDSDQPLSVECNSPYEGIFLHFFWDTIQNGLNLLHKNLNDIHGRFFIKNNIPMGAGIGFSSALCVVISRWFIWEHWLKEKKLFDFARHLEDLYHGKSSGVDVAGAMLDNVIHFEKSGRIYKIPIHWRPKLYISYSGYIKNTVEAVNQVNQIRKMQPATAKQIDKEMKESAQMVERSLKMNAKNGMHMLASAIEHANHCFEEWHLITPELQQHIAELHNLGAIAVKPTGAGIGGYTLSLWDKTPPKGRIKLIPLFVVRKSS